MAEGHTSLEPLWEEGQQDGMIATLEKSIVALFPDVDVPVPDVDVPVNPAPDANDVAMSRRVSVSTFFTARSIRGSIKSIDTFRTALSGSRKLNGNSTASTSSWHKLLDSERLIPEPLLEKDWSGRGEHAEFGPGEKSRIDELLVPESVLGTSATALVESVKCRRILLARKTIFNRRMKRSEAIKEVKHLKRVEHSHIIRVVGTYIFKQNLSILLYPAAEDNLEGFMESIITRPLGLAGSPDYENDAKLHALTKFFGCLAHALNFLHQKATKHMDIKPKNLLVKTIWQSHASPNELSYKVYIADFGITRSYRNAAEAETDSRTSFTRMYAAPEVDRKRGLSTDIFSLGCVFVEMLGVLAASGRDSKREDLMAIIQSNEDQPWRCYQANIPTVALWLHEVIDLNTVDPHFLELQPFLSQIVSMIDSEPHHRPTSEELVSCYRAVSSCCAPGAGPDAFAADVAFSDKLDPQRDKMEHVAESSSQPPFSLLKECRRLQSIFRGEERCRQWMDQDAHKSLSYSRKKNAVDVLWRFLRRGVPLLLLFDIPGFAPFSVVDAAQSRAASALFLRTCFRYLHVPAAECFTSRDLYEDSIMGFVKVIKGLNRILCLLWNSGKANPSIEDITWEDLPLPLAVKNPNPSLNAIISNFVESERLYVCNLEVLSEIAHTAVSRHLVTKDASSSILIDLTTILEFHQRFLIEVEEMFLFDTNAEHWFDLLVPNEDQVQAVISYARSLPYIADSFEIAAADHKQQHVSSSTDSPSLKTLIVSPVHRMLEYGKIAKYFPRNGRTF
ncbi:kinase-like protein [Lophium mytilinum]|uniref:Kinase-like protein n=1 Tax=Lophium mytilinum TaxID=390894 RepID=A0A6A6QNQ6_9PEZI|nr:kinase-like protein [Lophium mytilinum]